jgi:putative nucleotidyltransferase with HDIG domain
MNEAFRYLSSLAQALAQMALYAEGHPARGRAADASFSQLRDLQRVDEHPAFSFIGREVVYKRHALRGMADWDWAERLSSAGVQRLEFDRQVTPEEYRIFLEDVTARIALAQSSALTPSPMPPGRAATIHFGAIGLREVMDDATPTEHQREENASPAGGETDFTEEADAIEWVHNEVKEKLTLPMAEAELVVMSLAHALRQEKEMFVPLLTLKEFDQYTTTHAINVAVLAMGLAEYLGLSPREARAYGLAGLLHDLGKVHVPQEILRNPGTLSAEEAAIIRRHPVDGARIILNGHRNHETCAVVAFEHHIRLDGSGYPERSIKRGCHHASLLVHVCDVFDALRTNRPYRVAWQSGTILEYIERRIGMEFDERAARAFISMMSEWESRTARARVIDFELPAPALL